METKVTWRNPNESRYKRLSGTIKFEQNIFTFTDESGKELIRLRSNEIDRFAAGMIVSTLLRYKITTKSDQPKAYTFSKYWTGAQQFAYLLKSSGKKFSIDNLKFTDTGYWIKAFKDQGVRTRNYTYFSIAAVTVLAIIVFLISLR